jgi:hypothetical protein
MLLEQTTFKSVASNLEGFMNGFVTKPRAADVPKIRIELATLAVMNQMPQFGMDSLKKQIYENAYAITNKIAGSRDFVGKEKVMQDGIKVYTSYIGLTEKPEGFTAYDAKHCGPDY